MVFCYGRPNWLKQTSINFLNYSSFISFTPARALFFLSKTTRHDPTLDFSSNYKSLRRHLLVKRFHLFQVSAQITLSQQSQSFLNLVFSAESILPALFYTTIINHIYACPRILHPSYSALLFFFNRTNHLSFTDYFY